MSIQDYIIFIYDITKEKSLYNERARAEIAEELNDVLKSEIKEHKKTLLLIRQLNILKEKEP